MKKVTLLLAALSFANFAYGEGKIEDVVGKLQEAKTSTDPVPILEKAKEEFKKVHPGPNETKETAAGIGPKRRAAIKLGAEEVKHHANEAIERAIEAAKAGNTAELGSKIDAAISEVHHTANEKR
jgi:hypothetical protein